MRPDARDGQRPCLLVCECHCMSCQALIPDCPLDWFTDAHSDVKHYELSRLFLCYRFYVLCILPKCGLESGLVEKEEVYKQFMVNK